MYKLIGGTGRSGTTILSKIFATHPEVADVPEWRFAVDPDGILDCYSGLCGVWTPYLFDTKIKRLENLFLSVSRVSCLEKSLDRVDKLFCKRRGWRKLSPRYARTATTKIFPEFNFHAKALIDDLAEFRARCFWVGMSIGAANEMRFGPIPERNELTSVFRKFFLNVANEVNRYQGTKYYLEKNTWNILWFKQWQEILPDSKLVHIYRDPRDVVASYVKQTWMPSDPIQSASVYRNLLRTWFRVREEVSESSYYEISLEELVQQPEAVLEKICSFWDIPMHSNLLKVDLNRSNSGRWRKEFPHETQRLLNELLHDEILRLGYEI